MLKTRIFRFRALFFFIGALMVVNSGITRAGGQPAPLRQAEPPPITKIVLYKHGIGYVEREGKVEGAAVFTLSFRAEQMKDLLKSFFALDLNGGKIASIQYETMTPPAKQLQDILLNVPEQAALSQFFVQLKGAKITVKAAGETWQGRILGIEPVNEIVNGQQVKLDYRLVLLTDAGPVRAVNLSTLTEFSLADETIKRDLNKLLDLTLDSKYTNRKQLKLTAVGEGERLLRLGYLVEMPVWKCSYRLIFDPKDQDRALLQGWALAENTTEEDWQNIQLSFVAGNPLSFAMDMYSPLYVRRRPVPVPGLADLPVNWEAAPPAETAFPAMEKKLELGRVQMENRKMKAALPGVTQMLDKDFGAAPAAAEKAAEPPAPLPAGLPAITRGAKVGELFRYEAQEKISIPRNQAAMAPILLQTLKGRKVLFYKAAFAARPLNAFVMQNDTKLTLDAGAVTFYEGDTALGEGILSHTLPPGSQEVVPYALDAAVDVVPQTAAQLTPHFKGRIADGVLTMTRYEILTTTWKITNRGQAPAVLWLDQPKNNLYHLSKPEKPFKEVDNHYRFELALKPGESRDFQVEEKRDLVETVALANSNEQTLKLYLSGSFLSEPAKKFLAELSVLTSEQASLKRRMTEWQEQGKRLSEEEHRLRANLDRMRNTPAEQELRNKWLKALNAAEERLVGLREQLEKADGQSRELEENLARKLKEYREDGVK